MLKAPSVAMSFTPRKHGPRHAGSLGVESRIDVITSTLAKALAGGSELHVRA